MIANKNPHIQVTVVDLSQTRIDAWNSSHLPIYEPGLHEIVARARDGSAPESSDGERPANLHFSTDVDTAIAEADLVFVSVNTPTKCTGSGAGRAYELAWFESAMRKIAEVATSDKIIVEKSTVPVRTADSVRDVLTSLAQPGVKFEILSNPEFLAEGTAIRDLLSPDRILIGSLQTESGLRGAEALANVYAAWVPRERIITLNTYSSELSKLAANCLLAQRISSINSLSALCEATGADIDEISYACGLDSRIGSKMLKASVGFGGSCFRKDVLCLVYIAESLHLPEVAAYWKGVVDINEYQKDRFTKRIISRLFNSLTNKKIALLGFAYKKNTADTRESAAITVLRDLAYEGAKISVYDPKVSDDQVYQDLELACSTTQEYWQLRPNVSLETDVYAACAGAHAVVILTEWDEFSNKPLSSKASPEEVSKRLDWARIAAGMQRPAFVFDGRNIIDAPALEVLGFRVECIGKPIRGKSMAKPVSRTDSRNDLKRINSASTTNWSTPRWGSDEGSSSSRRDSGGV